MTVSYILGALIGAGYIIYIIVEYLLSANAKKSLGSSLESAEDLSFSDTQPDAIEIDVSNGWIELPNKIPVRVYGFKVADNGQGSGNIFPTATKYALHYKSMPAPVGTRIIADAEYQEIDPVLIERPEKLERWQ